MFVLVVYPFLDVAYPLLIIIGNCMLIMLQLFPEWKHLSHPDIKS